jgi:hypothetical protein
MKIRIAVIHPVIPFCTNKKERRMGNKTINYVNGEINIKNCSMYE